MPAAVTIYDVAQGAAVSISTVSNVLNRPERVAAATRARVLAVADELGFVPKVQAADLARKSVGRIGVVAPFVAHRSYLRRLAGVLGELSASSTGVTIFNVPSAAKAPAPMLAAIPLRGLVGGLIVMGEPIEDAVEQRMSDRGLPVVVVDATSSRFSVVTTDDELAGQLAAEHLLSLGHRRFGYVLLHQEADYPSPARKRLAGLKRAVEAADATSLRVEGTDGSAASVSQAAHSLLAGQPDAVTAIVAHDDDLAIGVIRTARATGITVPGQLSVVGFDDGPVAEAADLTTVRVLFEESGVQATRILLAQIASPGPRTVTTLPVDLIARGTSSPVQ